MEKELKPAFGKWLRKLDPLLAGEDQNALYEAFRRRRRVHGAGKWWKPSIAVGAAPSAGKVLSMIGLGLLALLLSGFFVMICGCPGLVPFIIFVGVMGSQVFQQSRIKTARLPKKLAHVFSKSGFFEGAARDIWMTGARGTEVLEALYLEKREGSLLASVFISLVLALVTFGIYLPTAKPWYIEGAILMAVLLWLFWELIPTAVVGFIDNIRQQELQPRIIGWRSRKGLSDAIAEGTKRALIALSFLIIVFFILGAFGVGIGILIGILEDSNVGLPGFAVRHPVTLIIAFVAAILALALRLLRPVVRNWSVKKIQILMQDADFAFDHFMAGTVAEDPHGMDWACWMYARDHRGRRLALHPSEMNPHLRQTAHPALPPPQPPTPGTQNPYGYPPPPPPRPGPKPPSFS